LNNSWVGDRAITDNELFKSALEYKKAFFNASYANYDDCWKGELSLIPGLEGQNILALDFKQMIEAAMFYEDPPKSMIL
jgi:hypothetical protein